jgi:hypothetical protein
MLASARELRTAGHDRNACYLSGYVVECVLKTILTKSKYSGSLQHHRLLELRQALDALMMFGNKTTIRYMYAARLAPTIMQQIAPPPNPKSHWDPFHRYDGTRWTAAESTPYVDEASRVADVLKKMEFDGVLP